MDDLFPPLARRTGEATLSPCERYRYRLARYWGEGRNLCAFIMLNPSTADAMKDDPTIRRCIGYAKAWGHDGLLVGNLFALRSTSPKALYTDRDPVGPDNDRYLLKVYAEASRIVCAWGGHGLLDGRGHHVLRRLLCAGLHPQALTVSPKTGMPGHPLYLAAGLRPQPYTVLKSEPAPPSKGI